jgi:hypothetical protein
MATKTRGQQVGNGEIITLKCQFNDPGGNPADLDEFPRVQFIRPDSSILQDFSSVGIYKISTGLYAKDLTIQLNEMPGIFTDNWLGALTVSGTVFSVRGSFNFVVTNRALQAPNVDGYLHLGDDPIFTYSQAAIANIDILLKALKQRLRSEGRHPVVVNGQIEYQNCDIFNKDDLIGYLSLALSDFNSTPHFTSFTWEDSIVVDFRDVIVMGAYIQALLGAALIERGREFSITDQGVNFVPPAVGDLLNSQATSLMPVYRALLEKIKYQFKSSPVGLGTLRITAVAPALLRLRHKRFGAFNV